MSAAKIRKGDKVVVLSGKDKGKTGEIVIVDAQGRQGRRVGREHRHPSQASRPRPTRRAGSSARKRRCTSPRSRSSTPRTARRRASASRRPGRQEGPRRGAVRGEDRWLKPRRDAAYTPRLRKDYDERIVKAMTEKFGYKNALEVPQPRQDRHQHGRRRGDPGQEEGRAGRGRNGKDRWPEAGDHQGQEVDRAVQAARRHADRLQGHACAASGCSSSSTVS